MHPKQGETASLAELHMSASIIYRIELSMGNPKQGCRKYIPVLQLTESHSRLLVYVRIAPPSDLRMCQFRDDSRTNQLLIGKHNATCIVATERPILDSDHESEY